MLLKIANKYFDIKTATSLSENLLGISRFFPFYDSGNNLDVKHSITISEEEVTIGKEEQLVYSGKIPFSEYENYVYSNHDSYRFVLMENQEIRYSVEIDKAGTYSEIKIPNVPDDLPLRIGEAIPVCCNYSLSLQHTFMIHSSVVEYNGKGYLFLGRSGRGKSTHSRLWTENIEGASLLNDDSPYIYAHNNDAIVFGSPWSGKTACYKNRGVPIGGIVLLHQADRNKIEKANKLRALSIIMPCIVGDMKWDFNIHNRVIETVERMVTTVNVYDMWCTPTKDAAIFCFNSLVKFNKE